MYSWIVGTHCSVPTSRIIIESALGSMCVPLIVSIYQFWHPLRALPIKVILHLLHICTSMQPRHSLSKSTNHTYAYITPLCTHIVIRIKNNILYLPKEMCTSELKVIHNTSKVHTFMMYVCIQAVRCASSVFSFPSNCYIHHFENHLLDHHFSEVYLLEEPQCTLDLYIVCASSELRRPHAANQK